MRILFLNPQGYVEKHPPLGKTDTGGQIVYVLELAKALGRQGVDVDIITRQFSGREQVEIVGEHARIVRIPCGPDEFVVKENLYELMHELVNNLHSYITKNDLSYTAIHSHYWDGGYAGLLLERRLGVPHIFTPHSLGKWKELDMADGIVNAPPEDGDAFYRYRQRILVEKRIMRSASVTLMLSQTQRIKLMQHYSVDFARIKTSYPGVDMSIFGLRQPKSADDPDSIKTTNNLLVVSRFVPAKGIDRAIDIFNLVAQETECHLYVVTAGQDDCFSEEELGYQAAVQSRVRDYGLEGRVTFLGYIRDRATLADRYRETDIYLLPSRYEPFGMTTLEAMACGAVAVVSDVAGSCELIIDGVNGYIANMHDYRSTADVIIALLQDKRERLRTSENAVLTVQKHLAWDVIARSLIEQVYPAG